MRKSMLIGIIGGALALGACGGGGGGGKANKDDLVKSVVEALAKKDKAAFTKLYIELDALGSACPAADAMKAQLEPKFKERNEKVATAFDDCLKLGDWSKAKVVETKGGELRDRQKNPCPDAVGDLKDLEVLVDIDGKKVGIGIDDPMTVKGSFWLADQFECEAQDETKKEDAPPVADKPPAEAQPVADKPPAETTAPAAAAPDAGAAPAAAGGTGSGECDKFVTAYETCLKAMPEAARGQAETGLKQMKEAFTKIPDKSMLDSTCKQAYDSMKTSLGAICPGAFN